VCAGPSHMAGAAADAHADPWRTFLRRRWYLKCRALTMVNGALPFFYALQDGYFYTYL